jgi:PHD/YefM family antitoxin component YafN of YafNO toxin-antitoxin module
MNTLTAEEARQKLSQLIAIAQQDNTQFKITSEEGTVILLSEETYQNLLVTLELLSTPGLMNSLKCYNPSSEIAS